jgi:hypothetical protein
MNKCLSRSICGLSSRDHTSRTLVLPPSVKQVAAITNYLRMLVNGGDEIFL